MSTPWTPTRTPPPEDTPVLVCWHGQEGVEVGVYRTWSRTHAPMWLDGDLWVQDVPPTHWRALPVASGCEGRIETC